MQQRGLRFSLPGAAFAAAVLSIACGSEPQELVDGVSNLTVGGVLEIQEETAHGIPGCYRCSAAVADFDGDGLPDLVLAGAFDRESRVGTRVRLYRNRSTTGGRINFLFQRELTGVRGKGSTVVTAGDFNADGRPDFAVRFQNGDTPYSDTSAFMNDGAWAFTRSVITRGRDAEGTTPAMSVGDLNRDGRDDLLFASDARTAGHGLWYSMDTGGAWRAEQSEYAHRIGAGGAIAAGDLNGDRYPDLVVTGRSGITFGAYDCTSYRYGQVHLNRSQVTADGTADRSIAPGAAAVLGHFALRADPNQPATCTGFQDSSLAIADIDGDGHQDILAAGAGDAFRGAPGTALTGYDFVVLRNTQGTGRTFTTFEAPAGAARGSRSSGGATSTDVPSIAVGDMTGDGRPDVFLQGHRPREDGTGGYVFDTRFYVNVDGTRFTEIETVFPDVSEGATILTDLNNDRRPDLFFTGATRPFTIGASLTTDTNDVSTLTARIYRNTIVGTYGLDDIVPAGSGGSATADAGVSTTADSGTTTMPDAGTTSSVDSGTSTGGGDDTQYAGCTTGAAPLVGGGTAGAVNIVSDTGHGLPGCYRCGMASADFDEDGRVDVVMAGAFDSAWTAGMGSYTYDNVARLYRNVSCPGQRIRFQLVREVAGLRGGGGSVVVTGDFDGNGRVDFAVQFREGESPESDTSAFLNQGNMTFTRSVVGRFDTNSTSMGMDAADIDGDNRDDLIFISDAYGSAPGLWYKYAPASAAWTAQQTGFSHRISYGGTISAGDLNGDGAPDIVVGGNSNMPFGSYDCSSTLMYGQSHMNSGSAISPAVADSLGKFALRANGTDPRYCTGSDNAAMLIADIDSDGNNDVIVAGSSDGFAGPVGMNGSHYDFVVLRNLDGTGRNFVTFENAGTQYDLGTTNGGTGSLDFPNIAVGDMNGDGFSEVFLQGHHRDYANDSSRYVFDSRFFLSLGGVDYQELELGLAEVGEGGQAMEDFNNDGKVDLIFTGASIPFHSNGSNYLDQNSASTLTTYVYRNTRR
jgi:hypothetical protein